MSDFFQLSSLLLNSGPDKLGLVLDRKLSDLFMEYFRKYLV